MLTRIKALFRPPPPRSVRFVPPQQLTTFQRDSWHRSQPISLTDDKMEALAVFFARGLNKRWSFLDADSSEGAIPNYIILLEAESEAVLLEIFRVLAASPAASRLNRR